MTDIGSDKGPAGGRAETGGSGDQGATSGGADAGPLTLSRVLAGERKQIQDARARLPEPAPAPARSRRRKTAEAAAAGPPKEAPPPEADATARPVRPDRGFENPVAGLALSGGGIRSAAFGLGVLQALADRKAFDRIDYLSMVSGGGYIGAALTAALHRGGGFPFGTGGATVGTVPGVHAAVVAAAPGNAVAVPAPPAAPPPEGGPGAPADPSPPAAPPAATPGNDLPPSDVADNEAVRAIRDKCRYLMPNGWGDLVVSAGIILRGLAVNAVVVASLVFLAAGLTLLADPSQEDLTKSFLVSLLGSPSLFSVFGTDYVLTKTLAALTVVWLVGWAIAASRAGGASRDLDTPVTSSPGAIRTKWLLIVVAGTALVEMQDPALRLALRYLAPSGNGVLDLTRLVSAAAAAAAGVAATWKPILGLLESTLAKPGWKAIPQQAAGAAALIAAAAALPAMIYLAYLWTVIIGLGVTDQTARIGDFPLPTGRAAGLTFMVVGAALFGLSAYFSENANSLHRLYRDRLGEAFNYRGKDGKGVLLSSLAAARPYPIINAAVNIQGSEKENRRGRNADVFVFTPDVVGSSATGFARTSDYEAKEPTLDLATAVAISGAAVAPAMGRIGRALLAPTLALLNIRLSYWATNPKTVVQPQAIRTGLLSDWRFGYSALELLGLLDETRPKVNLSDGGHIENLGLYSLLQRRCDLIVVADAECDPGLAFSSLVALELFARVDLGVRLRLPVREIADLAAARKQAGGSDERSPDWAHGMFGEILYPERQDPATGAVLPKKTGYILYLKPVLTGDERIYMLDYEKRYPAFPQETTADQFFSEEQFEVYRALGYHSVQETLSALPKADAPATGLPGRPWREIQATFRANGFGRDPED
ncbi:hypothetical protein [Prosthecomicrobium sp. N25]|uniref:hypothetical protein n=1 Tax=Prosthecomicrobium sp. N25 TaxID=3129254 RepID=UPI0030783D6C